MANKLTLFLLYSTEIKNGQISVEENSIECHYNDVIMSAMASQIISLTIVYSTAYSGWDQRKHQSSASLAFVWGIHRWPVNSPHKWSETRKMFPFDDVIMMNHNDRILRIQKIIESITANIPRTFSELERRTVLNEWIRNTIPLFVLFMVIFITEYKQKKWNTIKSFI